MILRRLGNKSKIAKKIQSHFPPHKIYIEPFFGAGGMFFNKPKAKYNFLNDIDSDVFNLYFVVSKYEKDLINELLTTPIHSDLFEYWKKNKETEPIKKAIRFLFLSNFGYLGQDCTLKNVCANEKTQILKYIEKTQLYITDCRFFNMDFRGFYKTIDFVSYNPEETAFVYSDPNYLETGSNYKNKDWNEKDSFDCFDVTFNSGIKGAMSEFNHPFILSEAKKRNLNIINIGERQNLKNRRTEILITNYKNQQGDLFSNHFK